MIGLGHGPLRDWVVSIDLWGTLITYGDRAAEADWRIREFMTVLAEFGHTLPDTTVRDVVTRVRSEIQQRQRATGEQPSARTQVTEIVTALGITPTQRLVDVLLIPHTHAVLRACPEAIPGAHTALWSLKQAGARLVLTSNTLATPASVSRLILAEHGFTAIFDDLVFSSDIGLAKPRREVFEAVASRNDSTLQRVVHVGNSVTTDIEGALAAGCRAVLFNPRGKQCPPGVLAITILEQMPDAVVTTCARTPTSTDRGGAL